VPLIKSQPRAELQLAMSLIHTAVELSKARPVVATDKA